MILLHGNNDTPYPTACNPFGDVQALADHLLANGYRPSEVWALGYQGDQCDLLADQTRRSAFAHSTVANVPDLRAFVRAVLRYTGAKRVDIVGHSLGGTLAREWMRQDHAPFAEQRAEAELNCGVLKSWWGPIGSSNSFLQFKSTPSPIENDRAT